MKKKNSKQTLKKVNLDAFELRFSEEKLEIEAKSLQWKTVVGVNNYLYSYLLNMSQSEDGMKHVETQIRAMYCMSSMCHNAPIIMATDSYFNLVRNAYNRAEMKEEDVDAYLKISVDAIKEHVKLCQEKAAEVISEDEQEEALEDVKLMTQSDDFGDELERDRPYLIQEEE